jgi:hypothetical protein
VRLVRTWFVRAAPAPIVVVEPLQREDRRELDRDWRSCRLPWSNIVTTCNPRITLWTTCSQFRTLRRWCNLCCVSAVTSSRRRRGNARPRPDRDGGGATGLQDAHTRRSHGQASSSRTAAVGRGIRGTQWGTDPVRCSSRRRTADARRGSEVGALQDAVRAVGAEPPRSSSSRAGAPLPVVPRLPAARGDGASSPVLARAVHARGDRRARGRDVRLPTERLVRSCQPQRGFVAHRFQRGDGCVSRW